MNNQQSPKVTSNPLPLGGGREGAFKRTTVTSALPYANGGVHIGHLAGVYVPADIYVRYLRLKGEDVMFIGGSDEHGVPQGRHHTAAGGGSLPQDDQGLVRGVRHQLRRV